MWHPSAFSEKDKQASTKDNWLVFRLRSDRGSETERRACEMSQTVLPAGRHGGLKGSEPEFRDIRTKAVWAVFQFVRNWGK